MELADWQVLSDQGSDLVLCLDYLLLASQGGFGMSAAVPLFVCSAGQQPPAEGARTITLDTGHDDLLRDAGTHKLVAGLLRGEQPW